MEKKTWISPELTEAWGEDTMGGRNLVGVEITPTSHT